MDALQGRVAVVTGAASGIGRAVAERLVDEGTKVALADIEEERLAEVTALLTARGGEVIGVPTDVRHEDAIQALADATIDAFGAVHVVHNNAGVVTSAPLDQLTTADWEWTLGVDLWSVIFGVKIFLPLINVSVRMVPMPHGPLIQSVQKFLRPRLRSPRKRGNRC